MPSLVYVIYLFVSLFFGLCFALFLLGLLDWKPLDTRDFCESGAYQKAAEAVGEHIWNLLAAKKLHTHTHTFPAPKACVQSTQRRF